MAVKTYSLLLFAVLVAGCGPKIAPGELPELPTVETGHFLETVRDQLDSLSAAVTDDPLDAEKAGRLGMAYLAYRLDAGAETVLRRARTLQPRQFKWMYFHAHSLARLGRNTEAVTVLQNAITRKRYVPAQIRLGTLQMQLGDLVAAETELQRVVDDEPANNAARLELARLHLRADQPDKARTQLYQLLDQGVHAGSLYFALADIARRDGESEKAEKYLALFEKYRGVGIPIDDPLMREVGALDLSEKPLQRMARRLNQLGRTDEAMKMLHRALQRNPHSELTHAALVGAYGAMKQFDKVDEHYQLALESAPVTAPLLRNLGRARFYEKRITEARAALEQALEINPHDSSAIAWLGLVHLQQNDIDGGLALLEDALDENPRESLARHNLVNVLRKQGRHEEALAHMQELVLVEDKHSPRVWRQMGESYLKMGQQAAARDALSAAVASAERLNDDDEARRSAGILRRIDQ